MWKLPLNLHSAFEFRNELAFGVLLFTTHIISEINHVEEEHAPNSCKLQVNELSCDGHVIQLPCSYRSSDKE